MPKKRPRPLSFAEQLRNIFSRRKAVGPVARTRRLHIETLEARVVPATVVWQGNADHRWETAANWVGGVAPTAADDAVIHNGVSAYFDTTATVKSLIVGGGSLLEVRSGTLTVNTSATFEGGATPGLLRFDIAGTLPGGAFGRIDVLGFVNLGGTLLATPVGGYLPTLTDTFQVMTFSGHGGTTFADESGLQPYFTSTYQPTNLTLTGTAAVVTTTADSGAGSLRQAILDTNAHVGQARIVFALGTTPNFIAPLTALPTITNPVIIDGSTQPGYAGTPLIEIDGVLAGASAGFDITAGNTTVRGLSFLRWQQEAIVLRGAGNDTIAGNYLGLRTNGTTVLGTQGEGVVLYAGSNNNTIGGTTAADRNVISGNTTRGVDISGASGGSSGNLVVGNYIGTDYTGTVAIGGHSIAGVGLSNGATNNTIGGTTAGTRNVISGNSATGIDITGSGTTGNVVEGNYLGANAGGTGAIANATGVSIGGGATGNLVGTNGDGVNDAAEGNLISGNTGEGVLINGANDNKVSGNIVGLNAAGTAAVANSDGIAIFFSTGNVIGTDGSNDAFNADERNYISGNTGRGVVLSGANVVAGNWIGLLPDGTALGNQFGIQVTGTGSRVGTNADGIADAEERNVISGNTIAGIIVRNASTTGAVIAGNTIGTDPTGTLARPNATGIQIVLGAHGNTIGGTTAAARNLISGNAGDGIDITDAGTTGNVVEGNFIGTNAAGAAALANGGDGVNVSNGASNNTIGGSAPGVQSVVAGGSLTDVYGVAVASDGTLLVADPFNKQLVRVDPLTGAQTVLSSNGHFASPDGIALAANGDIYVADSGFSGTPAIIRVNPTTGSQTVVASGGSLVNPDLFLV